MATPTWRCVVKINLHDLAAAKGFSAGQLTQFGVRNGLGGVVIPYYDRDGNEHIKFQIRMALAGKDSFRWSPGEAKLIPYGLHRPIAYAKRFVWIVEGASDCWALWLNNQPALGLPGDKTASCLKLEHVEDCTTVAVISEHDAAGKRFPHRIAQTLYDQGFAGEVCSVTLEHKDARETALHCATTEEFRNALARGFMRRVAIERTTIALPNINVRLLSNITPETVKWVWNHRVPLGKSCVLAGDGGEGKTFLAEAGMAAAITTGASLPGGSLTEPTDVLIWNAEDAPEDTLYGRAERCGAALHRMHILDDVNEAGKRVPFGLRHVNYLDDYLSSHPSIQLVMLDPITALLSNVDGHTDTEVRGALQPFVDLAWRRRIAVLIVMHLKKGETTRVLHRLSGSIAFGTLGRSVMYLGTHAISGRKAIDTIKHNLAPSKPLPVEFAITEEDGIVWLGTCSDLDADTIEGSYVAAKRAGRPGASVDFVRRLLTAGPKLSEEIYHAATERGISSQVLRQVKENLGVVAFKAGSGVGARWFWKMPSDDREAPEERHLHAVAPASLTEAWNRPQWAQNAIDEFFPEEKSEPEAPPVAPNQDSLF